jgi:YVTN family beta-propeller protein
MNMAHLGPYFSGSRAAVTAVLGFLACVGSSAAGQARWLSPSAIAADPQGHTLYVALATANRIAVVDLATAKVAREIRLPAEPSGIAVSPDGSRLCVTVGAAEGSALLVDAARGKILFGVPSGHSPRAPVFSPDGKRVFVCKKFNDAVAIIDLEKRREILSVPAVRQPEAAALTPGGETLFVANLLPRGAASGDYLAAAVTAIDVAGGQVATNIALPNGSGSLRGIAVSPDGKHVYVSHTLSRYQLPTTQLDRGWMNTSALTVLDAAGRRYINTVLLDDVDRGAANPWGVACTADGAHVLVAHAGTHELSVIDRAGLHAKLDKLAGGSPVSDVSLKPEDAPNDLTFLLDLRSRIRLPGLGPRGVAAAGGKAYVTEYFSDAIAAVDVPPTNVPAAVGIALGPAPEMTVARRGELYFHDATMCFQQWQSCTSCHPDSRADGFNWDLLNDGIGNPKQVKNMLYAHRTPPAMISGVRESAEKAVRAGMRYIQFTVRPEEDSVAVDEYLKSLEPLPSPHLVRGRMSDAARRGKKVFEKAGCAECHPSPLFTDQDLHDVGTAKGLDAGKEYDTPCLVECWRTAPYLCDGRAATIRDVLTAQNPDDRHGSTKGLGEKELADLEAYVLSL